MKRWLSPALLLPAAWAFACAPQPKFAFPKSDYDLKGRLAYYANGNLTKIEPHTPTKALVAPTISNERFSM